MNSIYISKALRDVWKWKDEAYREVAGLPAREAIEKRLHDSERTARELGFYPTDPEPRRQASAVAEPKAEYVTKKKR